MYIQDQVKDSDSFWRSLAQDDSRSMPSSPRKVVRVQLFLRGKALEDVLDGELMHDMHVFC